jgi:uncharacterized protein DUF2877
MDRVGAITRMSRAVAARLDAGPGTVGHVHSVFERAINLQWPDGGLLALHGSGPLLAPFAASVDHVEPLRWLRIGTPVTIGARRLVADGLSIPWPRAEVVDCSVDTAGGRGGRSPRHLRHWRGRHSASLDSAPGVAGRVRLAAAIRERDAARLIAGAGTLLGLGDGLTPSGDDCLVGALAVLHHVDREWLPRGGASAVGAIAGSARERTTTIGREFVLHALAGRFSEPVLAVLRAISPDEQRRAVARLAGLGATSGADTLCGMRLACRSLAA